MFPPTVRWRVLIFTSLGFLGTVLLVSWYATRAVETPVPFQPAPAPLAPIRPPDLATAPPTRAPAVAKPATATAPPPTFAMPAPPGPEERPVRPPQPDPIAALNNPLVHSTDELEAHLDSLADAGKFAPTKDGIRGAIREKLPEIQQCYEAWHGTDPTLKGVLKVRFTIDSVMGRDVAVVNDVKTEGMEHAAFSGCVRNVVNDLRFEPPEGGGRTNVTYPFRFDVVTPDAG